MQSQHLLISCFLLLAISPSGCTERESDSQSAIPSDSPRFDPWLIAGESALVGSTRIELAGLDYGWIRGWLFGVPEDYRVNDGLKIFLNLWNEHPTKRLIVNEWPGDVHITDEFDNVYPLRTFPVGFQPTGDATGAEINPERGGEVSIFIGEPSPKARKLFVEIPGSIVGESENFHLLIDLDVHMTWRNR